MNEPLARRTGDYPSRAAAPGGQGSSANLADILERVLDKGIVIAGDIQINLLDIELLTIKLRLLVASVDKAKEMGIDWWEHDPSLSSRASDGSHSLAEENKRLRAEIEALREELPAADEEEDAYEEVEYVEGEGGEEDEAEPEESRPAPRRAARTSRAGRPAPRARGRRRDTS
ncbi:gas vesicle protein [Streptomyces kronopolitis]|uniref:gas vesicle protein n=1 Tax=Streptomyces kronopolitis TaxID=1612435 RepID=UPI0020C15141|nr:gas vesicle protein [Streptomyces kronopolitis]MCL6297970.1 gas vesicle protein [Streptomyces kronopolitis]